MSKEKEKDPSSLSQQNSYLRNYLNDGPGSRRTGFRVSGLGIMTVKNSYHPVFFFFFFNIIRADAMI